MLVFAQFAELVIATLDAAGLTSTNSQNMASIICIAIEDRGCCSCGSLILNAAGIAALLIGSAAKATGAQIAHITSAAFTGMVIVRRLFERYIFTGLRPQTAVTAAIAA